MSKKKKGLKQASTPEAQKLGFFNSTLGLIVTALTLLGMGFAAGQYYKQVTNTLENNDLKMRLNKEVLDIKEKDDAIIHDLRNQIYELQNELLNLKSDTHEE